jgi:hypothetical protein
LKSAKFTRDGGDGIYQSPFIHCWPEF